MVVSGWKRAVRMVREVRVVRAQTEHADAVAVVHQVEQDLEAARVARARIEQAIAAARLQAGERAMLGGELMQRARLLAAGRETLAAHQGRCSALMTRLDEARQVRAGAAARYAACEAASAAWHTRLENERIRTATLREASVDEESVDIAAGFRSMNAAGSRP